MSEKLFIKPAPGRKVRDPITTHPLADKGEKKPRNTYWLRRIAEGDVIDLESAKKQPQKKAAKSIAKATGAK